MTSDLKNTLRINGRNFIYPKFIKGKLYRYREWFSYGLIIFLFLVPFIKFKGEQLVLLNLLERKFVFFGFIFAPQDFYLFGFATILFIVSVIFFTVIFGRLWCGWACPQTIFMEMIFRRIEFFVEGDAQKQMRLDQQPWNLEKVGKKAIKHGLWLFISLLISNTFLAYVIGSDQLIQIITDPVSEHLTGFIAIWVFTFVFYFVFSYVREIVCTAICPYGRLQGVLLDSKSVVVAYDQARGEPRGKHVKNSDIVKGDCIDCGLCVQVCPTGIDIRNGTQMECVNCTACIDACDMVMHKIGKPKRLIGFFNDEYVKTGLPFRLGKRACGYGIVLLLMIVGFASMLLGRSDVQVTLLRASGTLYQQRPNSEISNLYTAELVNKTNRNIQFQIRSVNPQDKIEFIQGGTEIAGESTLNITFFLIKKEEVLDSYKSLIHFEILEGDKVINKVKSTFYSQPK